MKRKYIRNLQKDRLSKRGVKKGGTNSSIEGVQDTLPYQSRPADSSDASRYAEDKVTGTAKGFTTYASDRLFLEGQAYAKARHHQKILRKRLKNGGDYGSDGMGFGANGKSIDRVSFSNPSQTNSTENARNIRLGRSEAASSIGTEKTAVYGKSGTQNSQAYTYNRGYGSGTRLQDNVGKRLTADKRIVKHNSGLDSAKARARMNAAKRNIAGKGGIAGRQGLSRSLSGGASARAQSLSRALNGISETIRRLAPLLSITSLLAIAVVVIVVVVMILGLTISAPFGEYDLELSDNDFVNIALSQVGTRSGEMYWEWYGFDYEVGWCACFVSWCANEAGLLKEETLPKFAWVPSGVVWFQQKDSWHENSITPEPGMIIFFDWFDETLDDEGEPKGQDGEADHVGIVEKVKDGYVYTIEGNTTDEGICKEKRYPIGYYEILGYGKTVELE